MDQRVDEVLATYHEMIRREAAEREARPRPPGGRHTEQDPSARDPLLRAVGPETGRLLNILARSLDRPRILELGTSYGYSTIWLAEAALAANGRLVTIEQHDYKSAFAGRMLGKAGLAAHVDLLVGDAPALTAGLEGRFDLVLLDLWKDLYRSCLEAFQPLLSPGAIVVADNMTRPGGKATKRYAEAVRSIPGMRSLRLPVGSGLEISRWEPPTAA